MPRFAANLTMMYGEYPFPDRFAAAAKDGFTAVEFLFPYEYPANDLATWLREHGLIQVLLNAPPGDWRRRAASTSPDRCQLVRVLQAQLTPAKDTRLDWWTTGQSRNRRS